MILSALVFSFYEVPETPSKEPDSKSYLVASDPKTSQDSALPSHPSSVPWLIDGAAAGDVVWLASPLPITRVSSSPACLKVAERESPDVDEACMPWLLHQVVFEKSHRSG